LKTKSSYQRHFRAIFVLHFFVSQIVNNKLPLACNNSALYFV
jgi:hypothetical protein